MRIYVAHPIRGKTGSSKEIEDNLKRAGLLADRLDTLTMFVPYPVGFYVPGTHDTFPQKALELGLLNIDAILDIDQAILKDCDAVMEFSWVESSGVKGEVAEAKRLNKPTEQLKEHANISDIIVVLNKIRKELYG